MTPAGIEPTTFRFVAQYLEHCTIAFPNFKKNFAKFCELYFADKQAEGVSFIPNMS